MHTRGVGTILDKVHPYIIFNNVGCTLPNVIPSPPVVCTLFEQPSILHVYHLTREQPRPKIKELASKLNTLCTQRTQIAGLSPLPWPYHIMLMWQWSSTLTRHVLCTML